MQELVLLPLHAKQKEENVEEELNVVYPLVNPYNLFLNLSELLDPDLNHVYFFAYILGKERVVMWGVYDKETQDFYIEGTCRYRTGQLYAMTKVWKAQGQVYVANAVKNRINERLNHYMQGKPVMSYEQYLKKKFILGYLDGKISLHELENKYPGAWKEFNLIHPLSPNYELDLDELRDELQNEIDKYQKTINRLDVSNALNANVSQIVAKITQRFKEKVEREDRAITSTSNPCPDWKECQEAKEGCEVYYYGSRYSSERDLA